MLCNICTAACLSFEFYRKFYCKFYCSCDQSIKSDYALDELQFQTTSKDEWTTKPPLQGYALYIEQYLTVLRAILMPNTHGRRDSTVELSRVGDVNAAVGSRDPVYNFLCCWAIEVGDKWIYNDVIVINIDQNTRSQTACSVLKLLTESVGSRRELIANCVQFTPPTPTRRNSTVASRFTRVGRLCIMHI